VTKVALIQCPSWTSESPNYTQGYLTACLKKRGHQVACFDVNRQLFEFFKGHDDARRWNMDDGGNCWYLKESVESFFQKNLGEVDRYIDQILQFNADIVGFSVYSTSEHFTARFCERLKARSPATRIVWGGPQCHRNSASVGLLNYSFLDAVCVGEGEIAFPDLMDQFTFNSELPECRGFAIKKANGVKDCGDVDMVPDLDIFPQADYSEYHLGGSISERLGISTSRGCIFRCKFCHEGPQWKKFRTRSAQYIVDEMKEHLKNYPTIKYFHFNDSLINGNIRNLHKLCDLLIAEKLNVTWGGQALIQEQMTDELLGKMKAAGCSLISYGIESGSQTVLNLMNKRYKVPIAEAVLRRTHAVGIYTIFNIIVGFPGETRKEFQETLDFVRRNLSHADLVSSNLLLLLEGSELMNRKDEYGLVVPEQHLWYTKDENNTYVERIRRLNALKRLITNKSFTIFSDGDNLMHLGKDSINRKGYAAAIRYYTKARTFYKNSGNIERYTFAQEEIEKIRAMDDVNH
jgi:anaerobic magnesium-protoporphyrin IX monomethyl ester cyclase